MLRKTVLGILRILALSFSAVIWFAGCEADVESFQDTLLPLDEIKSVTSRDLGHCPFEHDQLKDVPVSYGLLYWTPELHQKADNLEFWPGGCIVRNEKSKVVCTECRYAYDSFFKYWEKQAETASDFERPLSKLIAAFPIPLADQLKSSIGYYQRIKDRAFYSESLIYWSSEDTEKIATRILQYLRQEHLNPSVTKSNFQDRRLNTIKCKSNDMWVFVDIIFHGDMKRTVVHVDVSAEQAAKIKDPLAFVTED